MDLAQLLIELRPLCQHPEDSWDRILELLDRSTEMCEYEVARFMVSSALRDTIEPLLSSRDPRERLRAVKAARLVYARADASRVLRAVVKDPDPTVRAQARYGVRSLGLDDRRL